MRLGRGSWSWFLFLSLSCDRERWLQRKFEEVRLVLTTNSYLRLLPPLSLPLPLLVSLSLSLPLSLSRPLSLSLLLFLLSLDLDRLLLSLPRSLLLDLSRNHFSLLPTNKLSLVGAPLPPSLGTVISVAPLAPLSRPLQFYGKKPRGEWGCALIRITHLLAPAVRHWRSPPGRPRFPVLQGRRVPGPCSSALAASGPSQK